MGQLWETIISKLNALVGGTPMRFGIPFTSIGDLQGTCEQMQRAGFAPMGREQMYSGITGEQGEICVCISLPGGEPLDGPSFIGSVFYQRLRHMVVDKMHARSLGPVNQMVRHMDLFLFKKDPCSCSPPKAGPDRGGFASGKWKQASFSLTAACIQRDCLISHGASAIMQERLL